MKQKYGKLTPTERIGTDKNYQAIWAFKCDCGKIVTARLASVKYGAPLSCGCSRKTHGMEGSRVYKCWQQLKNRCLNSNDHSFANYGGRGLKVSRRWMKFENFFKDMGEPLASNSSIDRIDNLRGYFPGNCRWATTKQQTRNRRSNTSYTYMGKTKCLSEWAEYLGLSYGLLKARRRLGWDFKRMITEPIHLEFRR